MHENHSKLRAMPLVERSTSSFLSPSHYFTHFNTPDSLLPLARLNFFRKSADIKEKHTKEFTQKQETH